MMIIAASSLSEKQKEDIRKMVENADGEFVPPLSARSDTTQKKLLGEAVGSSASRYSDALMKQSFILCIMDGHVTGFLSYIPDYELEVDGSDKKTCDYVSTIIVEKENRGKGISACMYKRLFSERPGKTFVTRTWSSNAAHISVLVRLDFHLFRRINNDRGAGIDTVYFIRGTSNEKQN